MFGLVSREILFGATATLAVGIHFPFYAEEQFILLLILSERLSYVIGTFFLGEKRLQKDV